ncbi:MAG: EAL domain-containing protein [Leptolyngbyaceae cyanobacterium SM2_5_2]|nr:EAL domain-containing protein [Leptolyngbyaceae cyanobacterium SM2_5_2]
MVHFRAQFRRLQVQQLVTRFVQQLNFGSRAILVSTLLAMTGLTASNRLGWLQPLESSSFDFLTRLQPHQPPDERLLLVEVTESDLATYGWPLSDQRVADIIAVLQKHNPAVVGLDLYRSTPQSPGREALAQQFEADNVIGIMNVGGQSEGGEVPAPREWPQTQVGFNDFAIDPDGVLRRSLLFVGGDAQPYYSFPLRVVLAYQPGLTIAVEAENDQLRLGDRTLPALMGWDGGYANIDNRGYQILMKYRTPYDPAPKLTISQVLAGAFPSEWVEGKVVLIGSTASSLKDEFLTPYSREQSSQFMMSGVEIHAQSISQLLDAIAGEPVLYRFLPRWGELLWLLGWVVLAGILGWRTRRPTSLSMTVGLVMLTIWGLGGAALTHLWWLPTIEPMAGFLLALGLVVTQKALYRTSYDQLTLLPGRDVFLLQVQRELNQQRRADIHPPLTVVFLDIDRFKLINQSFGHSAGDRVLQTIAKRLRQVLPDSAQLARVGGDEFAFLLPLNDQATVDRLLNQLQTELAEPITLAKRRLSITSSMGLAIARSDFPLQPEDLLRDAHTAMYRAKALNEDRYEVFATTMRDEAVRRLELESQLLHASENQEFLLHYQPIVCLQTGYVTGFEALLRWYRPGAGFVSPGQFIQVIEETGLIINLGQWIFREASRQLKAWQQQFPEHPLKMSINLSRRQFHQVNLVEQFAQCLNDLGIDGRQIQLEITESMIMHNVEAARQLMEQLKALGLQLAIDDFGTGYSSLSYLHRFPSDTLKIDQSFVGRMDKSHDDREIVHTIIALGRKLGMNLVAEGIETQPQVELLLEMGCWRGQGYWFSKPLAPAEAKALITAQLPLAIQERWVGDCPA